MNAGIYSLFAFIVLSAVAIGLTGVWHAPIGVYAVCVLSLIFHVIALAIATTIVGTATKTSIRGLFEHVKLGLTKPAGKALYAVSDNAAVFFLLTGLGAHATFALIVIIVRLTLSAGSGLVVRKAGAK